MAKNDCVCMIDENGKRHYPKRSRREKRFGHLRKCYRANPFHGFTIQPGMWYGEDADGYFATYGDTHKGCYAVYRPLTTVDKPETRDDWVHLLEPLCSDLSMKLDDLSTEEREEMLQVREREHEAKNEVRKADLIAKRQGKIPPTAKEKLNEFVSPDRLGLRQTKDYQYRARGRKITRTERNMVDVDPTYQPRRCVNYLP